MAGESGTVPALRISVWVEAGVPEQWPLAKKSYETLPVGVKPWTPVTVAVS